MGGRYLQSVRIMHSFFIHEHWAGVRAVSQVLSMWPCKRGLDKESQDMPVWLSKMVLV
jgi:hypothetical protein